jgi:hypothetical protein
LSPILTSKSQVSIKRLWGPWGTRSHLVSALGMMLNFDVIDRFQTPHALDQMDVEAINSNNWSGIHHFLQFVGTQQKSPTSSLENLRYMILEFESYWQLIYQANWVHKMQNGKEQHGVHCRAV